MAAEVITKANSHLKLNQTKPKTKSIQVLEDNKIHKQHTTRMGNKATKIVDRETLMKPRIKLRCMHNGGKGIVGATKPACDYKKCFTCKVISQANPSGLQIQ
uniref:Uncharacterized protein n=1 Tax=Mucochytrium quahogii TaxID=96639 RepID=A0A7S2S277_9STRA|mmetsp:Transcript_11585/g.18849  ORF Transcript_11585/g.18849 Transcript_11585/m.18849 type:complete len:102 (-) Transcript_11585:437-742(-)